MKPRASLYTQEAAELLRNVSMYPGLTELQLCRFQPGKERKVKSILTQMKKQGRIYQAENGRFYSDSEQEQRHDPALVQSVAVLLDFIEHVEYHTLGEFPAKLLFFANGELYEVIYACPGQEVLLNQVLSQPQKDAGRRIVLVEDRSQIDLLNFPHTAAFCIVSEAESVTYYQKGASE